MRIPSEALRRRRTEPKCDDEQDRGGPPPDSVYVHRIVIDGNSVLLADELRALTEPYENRWQTFSSLKELARKITRRYGDHGYFLTRAFVPEQEIEGGVVQIRVVEGRLGELRISGNHFYSDHLFRRFLAPAIHRAVRRPELERSILLINDHLDLHAQVVLTPGREEGTTVANIKVCDESPLHLELDADNYGSRLLGEVRGWIGALKGSTFIEGDLLHLRGGMSTQVKDNTFIQFEYSAPVSCDGLRLGVQYSNAATTVGQELKVLNLKGQADILGFNVTYPLWLHLTERVDLLGGLIFKDVRNYVFDDTLMTRDQLRLLTVGLNGSWFDPGGRTLASGLFTFGLGDALGGTPDGSPTASRIGSSNEFTRFNLDATRICNLFPGHLILVRATAQAVSNPVGVSEQFSVGGVDSVRGFMPAEFLGDRGYTLSAEYRPTLVNTPSFLVQMAFFADTGFGGLQKPQVGEKASSHLTGAGVGMRFGIRNLVSGRVDIGVPVSPSTNAQGDKKVVYAQVAGRF